MPGADGSDPFARRKTVSRNYWATRQKDAGVRLSIAVSCDAAGHLCSDWTCMPGVQTKHILCALSRDYAVTVAATCADGGATADGANAPSSAAAIAPEVADQEPETPAARAHKVLGQSSCAQHACMCMQQNDTLSTPCQAVSPIIVLTSICRMWSSP